MKYLLVVFSVLFLVACGGGNRQTLPPELQGGPLQPVSPQNEVDPLSSLPFDSLEEAPVIEIEAEVEAQVDDEVVEELPGVSVSAANCSAITQDLETSFSDINFCDTNADCSVAAGSCPFGCYIFHNAQIDFADYQSTLETYQVSCNPCEYQCDTMPRPADRRCIEGRCVDSRFIQT